MGREISSLVPKEAWVLYSFVNRVVYQDNLNLEEASPAIHHRYTLCIGSAVRGFVYRIIYQCYYSAMGGGMICQTPSLCNNSYRGSPSGPSLLSPTLPLRTDKRVACVRTRTPPQVKGLVRVPHQVRKQARPTVSSRRAKASTPTTSSGRFSTNTSSMYYAAEEKRGRQHIHPTPMPP